MSLTLANRITIARILAIPLFILLVIYYKQSVMNGNAQEILRYGAIFLFVSSLLLDAVDGYIARTRHQITKLGTILDPLADKAILLSGLILLSKTHGQAFYPLPIWFILIVISRDMLLVIGSFIIQAIVGNLTVRPRISGKITTCLQFIVITWILCKFPSAPLKYIIIAAAGFTLLSCVQYVIDGARQLGDSGTAKLDKAVQLPANKSE